MALTPKNIDRLKKIKSADPYFLKKDTWLSLFPEAKIDDALRAELKNYFDTLETPVIKQPIEERLHHIRAEMKSQNLDAFVVFRGDEFNNEYVPACNERLEFATGFTGSAGYAVITHTDVTIYVDSRYTLQVRDECSPSLFTFGDLNKDALTDWIEQNIKEGQHFGIDGKIVSAHTARTLKDKLTEKNASLVITTQSPLDIAWNNLGRPLPPLSPVILYDEQIAGRSLQDKKKDILYFLNEEQADFTIFNELDSIAWFLNIRGRDIACTPVTLSYLIAHKDGRIDFFVDQDKITSDVAAYLRTNKVDCFDINDFYPHLETIANKKAALNLATIPVAVCTTLEQQQVSFTQAKNPCTLPKALKTPTEQDSIIQAHITDAVALVQFLHWVETTSQKKQISELDCVDALEGFREQNPKYKGPSFETISGFGSNGAIVHYRSTERTNKMFENGTLYLCDSGGQYLEGTTDVTRTIAIGTPSAEMKDRFTRVLKGHIGIALCEMDKGTTGANIDIKARASLREIGLDFGHGTGHGVGIYLSVHEGPQGISPRAATPLEPGMIISNEPGYYKDGEYGIRIENLVLVKEKANGQLYFQTLTLAPIDKNLIDISLMTKEEIEWLDVYHERVYKTVAPLLPNKEVKAWLRQATSPLHPSTKNRLLKFLNL